MSQPTLSVLLPLPLPSYHLLSLFVALRVLFGGAFVRNFERDRCIEGKTCCGFSDLILLLLEVVLSLLLLYRLHIEHYESQLDDFISTAFADGGMVK